MEIRTGHLDHPKVHALLAAHRRHMVEITPPESTHALEPDGLRAPEITFWTAWDGDDLLGCGAMKALGDGSGEIKSMRTPDAHRGRGVGRRILDAIIDEARDRRYDALYLETGVMPAFEPARRLYERAGFVTCGPFADYALDPNTVFMRLDLGAASEG